MSIHLYIAGTCLCLLALVHVGFPRYFQWDKELATLSLVNRQMMQVHAFFIALVVLMMGVLCITSAHALQQTVFGGQVALALAVFWVIRFFFQVFGYSSKLWRGKRFETTVHIFFTVFWLYLSGVFFLVFYYAPGA